MTQLRTIKNQSFELWAEDYFAVDGNNLDKLLVLDQVWEDCIFGFPMTREFSKRTITQFIKSYCESKGFQFNPKPLINDVQSNRILDRVSNMVINRWGELVGDGSLIIKQLIYVRSNPDAPLNLTLPGRLSEPKI